MSVLKQNFIGSALAGAMTLSAAFAPSAITAQEISGAQDNVQMAALGDDSPTNASFTAAPYQNGDRVEKSQVRDALNYYDIVFFSGDNIQGMENLVGTIGRVDGISAVALRGWNVSECTIVFSKDTINSPTPNATFGQPEIDGGWVHQYAKDLAGQDAHAVNGSCVIDNPSTPEAS